jgi:hypothetical protein
MIQLKIIGTDVTGGWSIDVYNPQKGHKIRFMTNIPDSDITDITWDLNGDGELYNTPCVYHVFKKRYDNTSPNAIDQYSYIPGEGYVTVRCIVKIKTKNNEVMTMTAERSYDYDCRTKL